ncbi:MAG: type II toxin-antitoxin system VapC family toxin [Opitutus sp.]|nr:type II toxin-antitoxin system VapC family toxin [Opitutus sp.]
MAACGIDTSIFVRVLTGLPAVDYQATVKRLAGIRASQPEHIIVANIVIAEAYAVLQHHYALSKADARAAILSALTSGLLEPAHGDAVLDALRESKEPGLTDRLIALDYGHQHAIVLTLDRKMAALPGCERL